MHGFSALRSSSRPRARALLVLVPGLASLSVLIATSSAHAGVTPPAVIPGQIVLQSGDTPTGGAAVVNMESPFVNDAGEVAFVGLLDDGDHYVFIGGGVVWLGSDDAMQTLSALEPRMDSNGLGNWVYPMDADGADGLYTDAGLYAVAGDPAADLPAGSIYTFLGNPAMTADGAIYYVVGIDDTGDGGTDYLAFYRTPDGTHAAAEVLIAGGDVIDMFTVDDDGSGIDFDYAVSSDGAHVINILNMEGDPASDAFVRVDDMFVARELDPTGDGDNWDNFDLVSINTAGNYLITGDTDGPGGSDEFIAYNATIAIREGSNVAGVTLSPGAELRFAALSDLDQAAYAWAYNGPAGFRETVFFACDAADIAGSSQVVFTTIDSTLDVDADGMGDYAIIDVTIAGATAGRAVGATPFVYAEVALDDGMAVTQAMIEVPVSCCGNGAVNPFEDCDDGNDDDTDDCLSTCVAASCGDGFLQDGVEDCDDGNDDDTDECPSTCVAASCGDGFVLDGVEECDDGNDDDDDDCLSSCVAASCGDGFVQDGVEECDDGNDDDADECRNDCTLPGGVDETAGETGNSSTGGSGGGSGPGPVSLTAASSADGTGGETDTDTDSDSAGQVSEGGCSCRTRDPSPASGPWSLLGLGLGLLGLRRRRR